MTFRGLSLTVSDRRPAFWAKMASGRWERATFDVIDALVDESTLYVDIGAWIGPTALYAASKAKRVIAFEPDPIAAAELRENVALNPALSGKITVRQKALWPESGRRQMGARTAPGDSMSSLMHRSSSVQWEVDCVHPSEN